MRSKKKEDDNCVEFVAKNGWDDLLSATFKQLGVPFNLVPRDRFFRKLEDKDEYFGLLRLSLPLEAPWLPFGWGAETATGVCNSSSPSSHNYDPNLFSQLSDRKIVVASSLLYEHLESKVELAECLKAMGQEDTAPKTYCLRWDQTISEDICEQISETCPWVLKQDGSSGGVDVHILTCGREVNNIIRCTAELQAALPFHEERVHIPGWVLQQHISSRRILGGKKFHARVYLLGLSCGDMYVHDDVEIRAAPMPVDGVPFSVRAAHITNGFSGADTHRQIMTEIPEIAHFTDHIKSFTAQAIRGCGHAIAYRNRFQPQEGVVGGFPTEIPTHLCDPSSLENTLKKINGHARTFSLMGVDVMIDTQDRFWILEVNHNPAIPPQNVMPMEFWDHLVNLAKDVLSVVVCEEKGRSRVGGFQLVE